MAGHWLRNGKMFAFSKQDLHAMYGEFIGTTLFMLLVLLPMGRGHLLKTAPSSIGMAGVQATVTNLSLDNASDGTSIQGSDAARLIVSFLDNELRDSSH